MRHVLNVFILIFAATGTVNAQVRITEIMYDLEGSDGGREWIEIHNSTSDSIDLTAWRLSEGGTNHKLTLSGGSGTITAGGFAIIADDASVFAAEFQSFGSSLLDSSFSLSNTGELLELKDGDLVTRDSLLYTSDWGGAGNSTSIQKVSSSWGEGVATPGRENTAGAPVAIVPPGTAGVTAPPTSPPSPSSQTGPVETRVLKKTITIDAGDDRTVTPGAATLMSATVRGYEGKILDSARILWNFGDGTSSTFPKTLHTYTHPGQYVVVVSAASGEDSASDRFTVNAISPDIVISRVQSGHGGFVELMNKSTTEIDLSWWKISLGEKDFTFPEYTKILAGATLTLSIEAMQLPVSMEGSLMLLYPNGQALHTYNETAPSGGLFLAEQPRPVAKTLPIKQEPEAISSRSIEAVRVQEEVPDQIIEQGAAAGSPIADDRSNGFYLYLSALAGLVAVSIFAVTFTRDTFTPASETKASADTYDIIEEK